MKKIQYSIAIVFSLALVFFTFNTFIYNQKQAGNHTGDEKPTVSGIVTNVDLSPMAYDGPALITIKTESGDSKVIATPSMGRNLCQAKDSVADVSLVTVEDTVVVRGEVGGDGHIVPCSDISHYLRVTSEVKDTTLGFVFKYQKAPNGYVLEDVPFKNVSAQFVHGLVLTERTEYEALSNSSAPREGPPTIQIHVYKNTLKQSAPVWAMKNPNESLSNLIRGETKEVVLGGANAVEYSADGLYANRVFVAAHGGYVYVLIGSYQDVASQIYQDFNSLVSSFHFIEPVVDVAPKSVTLSGKYVCLPHLVESDFQTMECAFGLQTNDGDFYAVNFGQSVDAVKQFMAGGKVTAEGFVVIKEALSSNQWASYKMKGIFTITKFLGGSAVQ